MARVADRNLRQFVIFHVLLIFAVLNLAEAGEKPIYGVDDRNEILFSDPVACRAAQSTVAILSAATIQEVANNRWALTVNETLAGKGWCADERFSDQLSAVVCSGFIISGDRVVTAAHCINSADDPYGPGLNCEAAVLVFDYQIADDGELPRKYRSDQVRTCLKVLDGEEITGGADWRVIQLNQSVQRIALTVLTGSELPNDTEMTVIGHPLGLPMKSARNGTLRANLARQSFLLNIDSFEGNSGSGVIVNHGGLPVVVGMLSSGSKDFVRSNQACMRSRICEAEECRGETATRASAFSGWADSVVTLQTDMSLPQALLQDTCS